MSPGLILNRSNIEYREMIKIEKLVTDAVADGKCVGLVIQWTRGSIPTPGVYSAAIPLGKGLSTVHY